MTRQEMDKLFDFLADYRKNEIRRSGNYQDRYCGTNITYTIGDYTIDCRFFCEATLTPDGQFGPDRWVLYVTPELSCNYAVKLSEGMKYEESSLYNCITDYIDALITTFQQMGPYVDALKKTFENTLTKVCQ